MSVAGSMLPEFDHEMASTRRTLERVPGARMDWAPHEKSMRTADLATHIANLPTWVGITLSRDRFDVAPVGEAPPRAARLSSAADLVAAFDRNVKAARAALAAADDATLASPWTLLAGGETVFTMPRAAVLRSFVMNHLIHHRAQLTVYLRLSGVPVPALYGPSADEQ
jgi:uncharacterized damage-inducible protein DinB